MKPERWKHAIFAFYWICLGVRLNAESPDLSKLSLERLAGSVLIVGFYGTSALPESAICRAIRRYRLGGVILFDRDPKDPKRAKNISSPKQLKILTRQLQACHLEHALLIAVDQEGGAVQRLKKKNGFLEDFPRASSIVKRGEGYAKRIYAQMASQLQGVGINYDLAPVVDLALNPKNHVIVKWGRSYGRDPKVVARYAGSFIDQMRRHHIVTSLKHFPGHGSSTGDTHKGFVDVSREWRKIELEPYRRLIKAGRADTIMVAHLFNRRLDSKYPASLSSKIVQGILREELGFQGVTITDDLQMGAITQKYTLSETLRLALNAGNDLLLFGNQLDPAHLDTPKILVAQIVNLVRRGELSRSTLKRAVDRIDRLKKRMGIRQDSSKLDL